LCSNVQAPCRLGNDCLMKIKQRLINIIFATTITLLFWGIDTRAVHAQSLGDPIIDITFGSGTATRSGPLPADSGSTTYTYSATGFPSDDYYTIANTTAGMFNGWWTTTDHTGNTGGYMMIVNGSYDPGTFYTRTVSGLCGNTTYQFAAWIKNLLNYSGILPNVTFSILTTSGTVLGTGNTGNIATGDVWIQYPFEFTTPANTDSIVLKMTNNAPGGIGNDIAIDDITFRPYGSQVTSQFSSAATTQSFCAGTSRNITVNVTSTLASGYEQKLQEDINGVGTDESAASTATTFTIASPTVAGIYTYRVVTGLTSNISSAECVVASNELTLTVTATPTAAFTVADTTCLGTATAFTDASASNGSTITAWLWNFGDGQTSTTQNPSHTYTTAGNFTVQLTATNSNGCTSATTSQTIHISALPVAAFSYSTPDCTGSAITLTDVSTSSGGSITSWVWNFGDNTTVAKTSSEAFQHTYSAAGTYTVTLAITNSGGCSSTTSQTITISPLPVVTFITPDVCLTDAYAAFTNTTVNTTGTTGSFTYLWNFGDPNANSANPNISILENPTHKYSAAAVYQVSLTVTSSSGCSSTTTKSFTVNGDEPVAAFTVLNEGELCSDRTVYFTNQATVNFGSITKVEMYYDYTNNPGTSVTYNSPAYGATYSYVYPTFHTPASQNYEVRMLAYSGGTCVSEVDKTITLLATPELSFPAIPPVCIDAGTVQLAASELSGISGSGVYTGTAVSSSGLFNPATAGPGTFTIDYIFTATNACADTISQTITVMASPTVTSEGDVTALQGGSVQLEVKAVGDSLTYLWSPAMGLSSTTVEDPFASPSSDITYTLTVTNNLGCSASAQVKVFVLQSPVIPNTFTPNGDGINDTWDIKYLDSYSDCTVQVFSRWGERVFSSVGYPASWDGSYNGKAVPAGVYYYVIDPKHGRSPLAGWVTIIR
jgi:gliding motility-associated-like protein